MTIRNYVDVQITLESAQLAARGFNTVMLLFEDEALDRTAIVSTSDPDDALLGGTSSELYAAFQTLTSQELVPPEVVVGVKRDAETWAEALSTIREENDSWYGILPVTKVASDITDIAVAVEAIQPQRQCFFVTDSSDVLDGVASNVAETLANEGYQNSNIIYSSDGWANAGLASQLGRAPGSFTFNFKEIRGVAPEDITATQKQNLLDNNCQVQLEVKGLKRTFNSGMTCGGEWIDIMHGVDWLTARISEDVFALECTQPKVPYTLEGAVLIDSEIKKNLAVASDEPHNFIKDNFETTIPNTNTQSAANRGERKLEGFQFEAEPTGATHFVKIRGNLVI